MLPRMISFATAKFIQIIMFANGILIDSKMSWNSASSVKRDAISLDLSNMHELKIAKRTDINLSPVCTLRLAKWPFPAPKA